MTRTQRWLVCSGMLCVTVVLGLYSFAVLKTEPGGMAVAGRSGAGDVARADAWLVFTVVGVMCAIAATTGPLVPVRIGLPFWVACLCLWVVLGRNVVVWSDFGTVRFGWYDQNRVVVVDTSAMPCVENEICPENNGERFDVSVAAFTTEFRDVKTGLAARFWTGPFLDEELRDLLKCNRYRIPGREDCSCGKHRIHCPGQAPRRIDRTDSGYLDLERP